MSEEIGPIPTTFEKPENWPTPETISTIPVPPPRQKAKRRKASPRQNKPGLSDLEGKMVEIVSGAPTISMADILRAKAILQQAEAALGVEHSVKKEAPVPLHPQSLEDPAHGDKTPAVVEWYHKNAPEEYKRRYSGRKTHLEDRRKERPYVPLPAGATPASMPADPDGFKLSQTDDSGRAPRNFRDI